MSKIFVIINPDPIVKTRIEINETGYILNYWDNDITKIGTSNSLYPSTKAIVLNLSPDTPVYCIDGDGRGKDYTIGKYLASLNIELPKLKEFEIIDEQFGTCQGNPSWYQTIFTYNTKRVKFNIEIQGNLRSADIWRFCQETMKWNQFYIFYIEEEMNFNTIKDSKTFEKLVSITKQMID